MSPASALKVGKRGTVVVPVNLRHKYGFHEGVIIIAEERDDGLLLRPAMAVPLEAYSDQRKAEFLLSNAVDQEDYERARAAVRELGVDPDSVDHHRPDGA